MFRFPRPRNVKVEYSTTKAYQSCQGHVEKEKTMNIPNMFSFCFHIICYLNSYAYTRYELLPDFSRCKV